MTELSEHDKAILTCVLNPNLPIGEIESTEIKEVFDNEELTDEVNKTKIIEIEAVELAESGKLQEGLVLLNEAIRIAPNRPSLYNNRANIYQFLRRFEEAFNDLSKAVSLCTENHQRTLSQAHCQRGLLHRRAERIELARADFEIAAKLGNKFAKSQLVELNPYAALCNQMLVQVMEKLK